MGRKSSPAPATAAPAPTATAVAGPDKTAEPANRAAVVRADSNSGKSNLMASDLGPADVDPLSQRKTLSGSASLMR